MPRGQRASSGQITTNIRLVEAAKDTSIEKVCKKIAVSAQCYYRWRKCYGGSEIDQGKHLKELN